MLHLHEHAMGKYQKTFVLMQVVLKNPVSLNNSDSHHSKEIYV